MNSKLISIKYIVHVFVAVPMGFDIDFNFPITIGTVPFIPRYDGWLPDEKAMIPQHRSGTFILCVCVCVCLCTCLCSFYILYYSPREWLGRGLQAL